MAIKDYSDQVSDVDITFDTEEKYLKVVYHDTRTYSPEENDQREAVLFDMTTKLFKEHPLEQFRISVDFREFEGDIPFRPSEVDRLYAALQNIRQLQKVAFIGTEQQGESHYKTFLHMMNKLTKDRVGWFTSEDEMNFWLNDK